MKKFRVTADALNLRSEPSLQGIVIDILEKGTVVDWLNTSGDGYWLKIMTPKQVIGWAASKYLIEAIAQLDGSSNFPWMSIARAELGVREVLGNGDNPPDRTVPAINYIGGSIQCTG
ncbi:SH3 domain-containing protein [Spirosoma rigui]|uniref:SH3 domain-containing protein n=1 Tax=Spirosoma rigui TaxID=564064 RepID=UPI0009B156BD|nr:SH3 domain-containing protein [Spirosoma rigui]